MAEFLRRMAIDISLGGEAKTSFNGPRTREDFLDCMEEHTHAHIGIDGDNLKWSEDTCPLCVLETTMEADPRAVAYAEAKAEFEDADAQMGDPNP